MVNKARIRKMLRILVLLALAVPISLSSCALIQKNVVFDDAYISLHKGKYEIEVPEVHELVNIAIALSKIGQIDNNMIRKDAPYYTEVRDRFLSYKNHPLINEINQHITAPHWEHGNATGSYNYYYDLKTNASVYRFDEKGRIKNGSPIKALGKNGANPINDLRELIEDFARVSSFRDFYKMHQAYYRSLVSDYKESIDLRGMDSWLRKKSGASFDCYRVVFSSLVGGAHSTQEYRDNGFRLIIMFMNASKEDPRYSHNVNRMLNERSLFTEIDHNFVRPFSAKYATQIDATFGTPASWAKVDQTKGFYGSPQLIFNEYMTWALFSLYCLDTYPKKDVDIFIPIMEDMMSGQRGFIRFKEFNRELMDLHKSQGMGKNMDALMEGILRSRAG